jgi:hypothetical protein
MERPDLRRHACTEVPRRHRHPRRCHSRHRHIPRDQAARSIDADGLHIAPGFIDLHTHYDAQLFWDPYCTLSGWHGVTSAVIGNCGFGFAPVAPDQRERAMLSMTRVEAIPFASMKLGMPWDWTSFPEYLDSVERTPAWCTDQRYVRDDLKPRLGSDDADVARVSQL